MGIVYLVQPKELLGTERYKIGCSIKNNIERITKGYRKGTRILYVFNCNNPFLCEKIIKENFRKKFTLIAGNEYFKGVEIDIVENFFNSYYKYILVDPNNILDKSIHSYIHTKCNNAYNIDYFTNIKFLSKNYIIKESNKQANKEIYNEILYDFLSITNFNKIPTIEELILGLLSPIVNLPTCLRPINCIDTINKIFIVKNNEIWKLLENDEIIKIIIERARCLSYFLSNSYILKKKYNLISLCDKLLEMSDISLKYSFLFSEEYYSNFIINHLSEKTFICR